MGGRKEKYIMNKCNSLDLRDWYWEEEKNNKAKAK